MSTEDLATPGAPHGGGTVAPVAEAGSRSSYGFGHIGEVGSANFGDGGTVNNGLSVMAEHVQLIHYWQAGQRAAEAPGGGFTSVAGTLAEQLREVFVEPAEFGRARDVLRERNAVLLAGPAGSGRRAAAVRLLDELGDEYGPIVENDSGGDENDSRDDEGDSADDNAPVPGESDVVDGARVLINLTAVESGASLGAVRANLDGLRKKARERGAFLVVVLPDRYGEFDRDFSRLLIKLRTPPPERVLERHLEFLQVRASPGEAGAVQLGEVQLRRHLATWSMDRVARFARFVRQARDEDPQLPAEESFRRAHQAVTRHPAAVEKQVAGSEPWQRALLLSAAMLPGSSVDAVYAAAVRLQQRLRADPAELDPLRDQGVETDLGGIDNVTVDPARRVRFSLLDYDTAVRTYFWSNYPGGVRDCLRDWVRDCVADRDFAEEDRAQLVNGFVEQAVRVRRARDVCTAAYHWCETGQGRHALVQPAGNALADGLRRADSPEAVREILEQLYTWARGQKLPRDLGRVLVDVCARVVVRDRPTAAITRLRLLASRPDAEVAEPASRAVVELSEDRRLCRRFLHHMRGWLADGRSRRRPADVRLFLRVVDGAVLPRLARSTQLLDEKYARTCLVDGVRLAWGHDREHVLGHLRGWFDAVAAVGEEPREHRAARRWLEVLAEAAAGAERAGPAQLYVRARDWAAGRGTGASHAVYGLVAEQVDRAAGIRWDSEEERW